MLPRGRSGLCAAQAFTAPERRDVRELPWATVALGTVYPAAPWTVSIDPVGSPISSSGTGISGDAHRLLLASSPLLPPLRGGLSPGVGLPWVRQWGRPRCLGERRGGCLYPEPAAGGFVGAFIQRGVRGAAGFQVRHHWGPFGGPRQLGRPQCLLLQGCLLLHSAGGGPAVLPLLAGARRLSHRSEQGKPPGHPGEGARPFNRSLHPSP